MNNLSHALISVPEQGTFRTVPAQRCNIQSSRKQEPSLKFIRRYVVSAANVHDSQCFEPLLNRKNSEPATKASTIEALDSGKLHGRVCAGGVR